MHSSIFLSASTNNRSVLGVFLFFKFKTETILPLIVKIPTKISALPKKINHRQQMYDSSKHSCHSIARPRSSSKLAGVPTQMFIVLHAGYKKKKYTSVTKQSDKRKTMATYCCHNNPLNLLPSYVCTDM